jgi:hypothetical protein
MREHNEQPWANRFLNASDGWWNPYFDQYIPPNVANGTTSSSFADSKIYPEHSNLRPVGNQDDMLDSWHAMVFTILLLAFVVSSLVLREFCAKWCPGECGPSSLSQSASRHGRIAPDPADFQEQREEQEELQRKERRLWYQYFLKPYTVVSQLKPCSPVGDVALCSGHRRVR